MLPLARLGSGVSLVDGRTAAFLGEYPIMRDDCGEFGSPEKDRGGAVDVSGSSSAAGVLWL